MLIKHLLVTAITLIVMVTLDYIWLGYIGKAYYVNTIGNILRLDANNHLQPEWFSVVGVYLVMTMGLYFFTVLGSTSVIGAMSKGAFFGFVLYATYEFTNHAILKVWSSAVIVPDLIWGTVLMGTTSAISFLCYKQIFA